MSRSRFRKWIAALAVLAWSPLPAAHADLSWTAPTQNTDGTPLTDLAGYAIYAGCFESGSYELQPANVGPEATTHRYEGLPNGATCYFAATAVNAAGVESVYSNEATKTTAALDEPIPGPVENLNVVWSGGAVTTYSENFGTLTSGQDVAVLSGWSEPSWAATGHEWTATTGTGTEGDVYVSVSPTADGYYIRQWDPTGSAISGPVEILIKHRIDVTRGLTINSVLALLMGNTTDSASYGVWWDDGAQQRFENIRISTTGTLTEFIQAGSHTFVDNTWTWTRYQIDGSGNHRFRIWDDGDAEPGTWTAGPTSNTAITSGLPAFGAHGRNSTYDVDYIALGTGGDAAPSPAGGAAANPKGALGGLVLRGPFGGPIG